MDLINVDSPVLIIHLQSWMWQAAIATLKVQRLSMLCRRGKH